MSTNPSGDKFHSPFCNHFAIGHNDEEFIFQFGTMYEGQLSPRIHATVITTPSYARKFLALLEDSLRSYKQNLDDEDES